MNLNLLNGVKVTRVSLNAAAGTSDTLSSDILDMSGYEGVAFVAALGTVTSGGVSTLQVQGNTVNSTSGMVTVTGTSASTDVGGANSDKLCMVDYYRPQKRYVRCQLVRATANIELDSIIAIQYTSRTEPTTQPTSVLTSALLVGV